MNIRFIKESEFYTIEGSRRVIDHEHAHSFAVIDLDENLGCYGLSWRSTLIEPVFKLSVDGWTAWVGADQQLAAISLRSGRICLALTLSTNIFQIITANTFTAVFTETNLMLFNSDFSIKFIQDFSPDITEEMLLVDNSLVIKLMGGESWTLCL